MSTRWIPNSKTRIERAQLARVFEQGLGKTIGYVLPLRRIPTRSGTPRWTSQPWFLAPERLFLVPGDSPLGYRLPLESLPWTKPEDVEWTFDPDPFRSATKLPDAARTQAAPLRASHSSDAPEQRRTQAETLPRRVNLRRGSRGRRCASSRATASCISSCRRSNIWRIISI